MNQAGIGTCSQQEPRKYFENLKADNLQQISYTKSLLAEEEVWRTFRNQNSMRVNDPVIQVIKFKLLNGKLMGNYQSNHSTNQKPLRQQCTHSWQTTASNWGTMVDNWTSPLEISTEKKKKLEGTASGISSNLISTFKVSSQYHNLTKCFAWPSFFACFSFPSPEKVERQKKKRQIKRIRMEISCMTSGDGRVISILCSTPFHHWPDEGHSKKKKMNREKLNSASFPPDLTSPCSKVAFQSFLSVMYSIIRTPRFYRFPQNSLFFSFRFSPLGIFIFIDACLSIMKCYPRF